MNLLEISLEHGKPVNMRAFEIYLRSSPPKMEEKTVDILKHLPSNKRVKTIQYRDAVFSEGCLNIYVCRFESSKCHIYVFGNLKEQELQFDIEISKYNERSFDILNERIEYILKRSKIILKSYYRDSKLKSIEYHLTAFLKSI